MKGQTSQGRFKMPASHFAHAVDVRPAQDRLVVDDRGEGRVCPRCVCGSIRISCQAGQASILQKFAAGQEQSRAGQGLMFLPGTFVRACSGLGCRAGRLELLAGEPESGKAELALCMRVARPEVEEELLGVYRSQQLSCPREG